MFCNYTPALKPAGEADFYASSSLLVKTKLG